MDCGVRLRQSGLEVYPVRAGGWGRRTLIALLLALAGAAAAIAATRSHAGGQELVTAIGGFATVPTTGTLPEPAVIGGSGIAGWPGRRAGWTLALALLPQTQGRKAAVDRAHAARDRGLAQVGILDSSQYASLHPGYWLVFAGVYPSQVEASSALPAAHAFSSTAAVVRVVP